MVPAAARTSRQRAAALSARCCACRPSGSRSTGESSKCRCSGGSTSVICTARFARTISSLYASGLPIITALQTARDTIGNAYIVSQFDAVLAQVRSGVSLSAALESVDGFQRKLCSSIAVGEETGQTGLHARFHRGLDGVRRAAGEHAA